MLRPANSNLSPIEVFRELTENKQKSNSELNTKNK